MVSGLLHSISGLLAILDENRQIIAVNNAFLQMLAIDDPENSLGLRPGEALGCVHAHEEPTGCGTTNLCSTCGAAIAIVSSLGQDRPVERTCALSAIRDGRAIEMALLVRSHPIRIEDKRFLLLFLQDITKQEQRAALERTFFHDISNMLSVIVGASEVLAKDVPSELADIILQMSLRLRKEVAIQRCLARNECSGYRPVWYAYTAEKIFEQLRTFFAHHQAATDKTINFRPPDPAISITTDISSLSRVLCNMIINALEATEKYGAVKVWIEIKNQSLTFCVWNSQAIPKDITNRVFQRNFSTKLGAGRGIGTYSMKLFGEEVLGGQVSFTSSEKEGTIFRFSCPLTPSFHKP
ncbi:MAG: ATP-binding protein [Desulfosarcina sp.]